MSDKRIHLQLLCLAERSDGTSAPETTQFLLASACTNFTLHFLSYFIHMLCRIFHFAAVEAYALKLNEIVPFGSLLQAELFASRACLKVKLP